MSVEQASHPVASVDTGTVPRRSLYRSFIQFLFSNLGLIIMVVAYSIGGAFLFTLLEQYIESQNCQQGNLRENVSITNLSENIYGYILISDDDTPAMHQQISNYLVNFTKDIYELRTELRYTGQDCTTSSDWTFPSALLFAITVITTIGYGHVTPVSWEGQITCICYALIGIPIFLLCLANISSVLSDIFRFMYSGLLHCCCCVCRAYARNRRRKNRATHTRKLKNPHKTDFTGTATVDPSWPEAYDHFDGKLGDEDDNDDDHKLEDDDDDDQYNIWSRMENRVPFAAVIIIFIGYICLGAFMFSRFEEWTMVESVYFCFVTLATIGFGDYVPGITSGSTSGLRFLLASFYILFGLAILAMCFDLIKEEILNKFRWVADKLGIIVNDEDQIDDDDYTQYASFQYQKSNEHKQVQLKQMENNDKRTNGKINSTHLIGEPPAYDDESINGKWVKNIRDRPEITTGVTSIKRIKTKDAEQ